jgi:hypothetical protein
MKFRHGVTELRVLRHGVTELLPRFDRTTDAEPGRKVAVADR